MAKRVSAAAQFGFPALQFDLLGVGRGEQGSDTGEHKEARFVIANQ